MTDIPLPSPGDTDWNDWAAEQEELSDAARDDVTGTGVTDMRVMTQAAYDALGTKSTTTLYVIQG